MAERTPAEEAAIRRWVESYVACEYGERGLLDEQGRYTGPPPEQRPPLGPAPRALLAKDPA